MSPNLNLVVNADRLAFYMGHAFSHAIQVQNLMAPQELMVPYVVYWQDRQPTPIPYPALTQNEAVQRARAAREQKSPEVTGWACGREGAIALSDGAKHDAIFIEGWVSGLILPLEMFVYYRKNPFRLVEGFLWKPHPQVRLTVEDRHSFMKDFQRGVSGQSFGRQCHDYIERSEPFEASSG